MTTANANAVATVEATKAVEVTLELWQLSKPEQFPVGFITGKAYDNGSQVIRLGVPKRKEIAATLNLKGKDNKTALDAQLLVLTDRIKVAGLAEFSKLAMSDGWTGKGMNIRQDKNGVKTATMVIKSVKRSSEVSVDQMSAALARMTPAERAATLARLAKAGEAAGPIIEQPVSEQLPPAAPEQPVDLTPEGLQAAGEQAVVDETQAARIEEMKAKGLTDENIKDELDYEAEIRAEAAKSGKVLTWDELDALK